MKSISNTAIWVFFLICSLTVMTVNSQTPKGKGTFIFKIAPLSFTDEVSFRSTQFAIEYFLSPKYSLEASYGQVYGKEYLTNSSASGFKSKLEFRKYNHSEKEKKYYSYFAGNIFFNNLDYETRGQFMNSTDSTDIYEENYFVRKKSFGINVKYGFELTVLKHFILDVYGGLGLRIKDVKQTGRIRPEDEYYSIDPNSREIRDRAGNYGVPDLSLGFKVGYMF
ncbi:MAG TPA: hypothetical protein PKK99_02285 [Bacteroidia bacterium]|nr:hypothetical protein [Bacteroidia bacterium]